MKYFLSLTFLLLLLTIEIKADAIDSNINMLTFHLGKRQMSSTNSFEYLDGWGVFTDNSIVSGSFLLQRKLGRIKRFVVNGEMGLNFRYMKAGYKASTMAVPSITEDFSGTSIMLGMQFGLSIERKIIAYRNHSLLLGLGFTGTGIFFNNAGTYCHNFGQDSVVLDFKTNRMFYVNPYIQARIWSSLGKRDLTYGCRYLLAADFDETNIFYSFYDTRYPDYYTHRGRILDNRGQLSFFVGIVF